MLGKFSCFSCRLLTFFKFNFQEPGFKLGPDSRVSDFSLQDNSQIYREKLQCKIMAFSVSLEAN